MLIMQGREAGVRVREIEGSDYLGGAYVRFGVRSMSPSHVHKLKIKLEDFNRKFPSSFLPVARNGLVIPQPSNDSNDLLPPSLSL